jgi:hypothetical protein
MQAATSSPGSSASAATHSCLATLEVLSNAHVPGITLACSGLIEAIKSYSVSSVHQSPSGPY